MQPGVSDVFAAPRSWAPLRSGGSSGNRDRPRRCRCAPRVGLRTSPPACGDRLVPPPPDRRRAAGARMRTARAAAWTRGRPDRGPWPCVNSSYRHGSVRPARRTRRPGPPRPNAPCATAAGGPIGSRRCQGSTLPGPRCPVGGTARRDRVPGHRPERRTTPSVSRMRPCQGPRHPHRCSRDSAHGRLPPICTSAPFSRQPVIKTHVGALRGRRGVPSAGELPPR